MRMRMLAVMPALMLAPASLDQTAPYDGRPKFKKAVDLSYYVWRDGNSWHVRWTTTGHMRIFAGSVTASGGKLKSFKRIHLESERKAMYGDRLLTISVSPRVGGASDIRPPVFRTREQDLFKLDEDGQITFSARTENDIDGFDFKVEDVEQLQIDLGIDGSALPNRVEIGRKNKKPSELPLIFTLK